MQFRRPRQDLSRVYVYGGVAGPSLSSLGLDDWSRKESVGGHGSFEARGSGTFHRSLHPPLPHLKLKG